MHADVYIYFYLYLYAFTFVSIAREKKKVGHTTQSKANEAVYHSSFIPVGQFLFRPPISDRFSNELETHGRQQKSECRLLAFEGSMVCLVVGTYIVEYDYIAKSDDELTVRKGDIITNAVPAEDGWLRGDCSGAHGYGDVDR